jgi:hypothetical protein
MKSVVLYSLPARTDTTIKFVKKIFKPAELKELDRHELDDIAEPVFTVPLFERNDVAELANSNGDDLNVEVLEIKMSELASYVDASISEQSVNQSVSTPIVREALVQRLLKIRDQIQQLDELKKSPEYSIVIQQTSWKDCVITTAIEKNKKSPADATLILLDLGEELFSSSAPEKEAISMFPTNARYNLSFIDPPVDGLYAAIGVAIGDEIRDIYIEDDRDVDSVVVISNLTKNSKFKTIELTYEGPKTVSAKGKRLTFRTEEFD